MTSDKAKLHFLYFADFYTYMANPLGRVIAYLPRQDEYGYRRSKTAALTEEEKLKYNRAFVERSLGADFVSGVDHVAFLLTDEQHAQFNTFLPYLSKVLTLNEVHRSEKFCNTNYFRGNNLQLIIYEAKYVD